MEWGATKPLAWLQRWGVALFLFTMLAFGVLVEVRSAFMERRMGDLDVFLRAAWAVRNDADLYAITSDNDWHYLYPPLYAILMTPLADPPPGEATARHVPYPISVLICYGLNLVTLLLGAHVLASALEERAADASFRTQPTFCCRWWALRMWPILICGLPVGHTLMRGQVNAIVLASLCAALAGWLRGQSFRAGLWLSLAICIKVIPAYLLVYPLWKRDGKALLGSLVGCLVGLVLIPGVVFGPDRAVTHYDTYARVFFGPFFKVTDDDRNKEEILGVNATDSIGVKDALHNWMYPDWRERPEDMHVVAKALYLLLGFGMTFVTLWFERRPGVHAFAGLIVLMAIFSPVCHSHYLLFCLPLVMCLLADVWQHQPTIHVTRVMVVCFAVFMATMLIAYLPGMTMWKDRCAALFATLPLWALSMVYSKRGEATETVASEVRQAA